jgi:ubiquinone/menaquinone biosynthesis C-methylase UbiE
MKQPTSFPENPLSNFHQVSYKLHEKHNALESGGLSELQKSWFREDNVDYWRHERMYQSIAPILHKNSKWITIGDGRFGLDSIKLKKIEPSLDILPTDISIESLEFAKNSGLIFKYGIVNAEAIEFPDNEFDYSFCKESFHHFPRPYIALYEMIRVSKKGIVFIEPNEHYFQPFILDFAYSFKNLLKRLLGMKPHHKDKWNYETAGNYIYSLSKREIEKVALGLNLPAIAFKNFNDYYESGVEFAKKEISSRVFRKVKKKIHNRDKACKYGLSSSTSIALIIFKEFPDNKEIEQLKLKGFTFISLPRNPYSC